MWGFNLGSCCLRWLYLFICTFRLKPKWLWQMAAPPPAWLCWRYLPVRREFFFLTVSKQSDCVYVELNWIEPKVTSWQPIEQQMQSKVWLNYYYYDDYYSHRKKSLSKTTLQIHANTGGVVGCCSLSSCQPWQDVIVRIGDKIHSHEKHTLCFKFSQSECPRLDISQWYLSNTQSKTWIPVGPCSFGPQIPAEPHSNRR